MAGQRIDTITCEPFRSWNRIECRPRTSEFDRVLSAQIHDPLWMLTRQWQFGEFKGEDTGSAVFAKVLMETSRITKFQNQNGVTVDYDEGIPLEAQVERMPVQYDLKFRVRAGQLFLKLLAQHGKVYNEASSSPAHMYDHEVMKRVLIASYAFELPQIDPDNDSPTLQIAKAKLLSNKAAHQALSGLTGRSLDGVACHSAFTDAGLSIPTDISNDSAYHADFEIFMLAAADEFQPGF